MATKKKPTKLHIFKVGGCPEPDKRTLGLLVKFLEHTIKELGLENQEIKIRLLGANPKEPITTGAYRPDLKTCSAIVGGRHMIDYARTIAHELVHLKQDTDGKLNKIHPEIGGEIEDSANSLAGRVVKKFIKNILTAEDKTFLGLGGFGR